MSQREFQASLGRMVADVAFRERVRAEGEGALAADLTPVERERLLAAAADRGMDATRMVHKDFRLSKLYIMLPMTRFMLGQRRMFREVNLFWAENLPTTHYLLQESLEFCDHLERRLRSGALRVKYLAEILAYERAELELTRPRADVRRAAHAPQLVRFRYDPAILLTHLSHGRRPRAVPPRDCTLVATLDPDGRVSWRMQL